MENPVFVRILSTILLFGITTAFNVNADNHGNGIDYTFAELRFVDFDGGDGIEIGGSYRLDEQFYLVGSYQDLDFRGGSFDVLELGGGYIIPQDKFDLAIEFTIIDNDFDNGFGIAAGGRGNLSPELEARVFIKHVDVSATDTFIELGADYYLNDKVSIGATIELSSDSDTLTFGGRYYF